MKIRQPSHVQPTYSNFTVLDSRRGEVILNLCFAEGDAQSSSATVVHKVVLQTANFARLVQLGQELIEADAVRYGDLP
ncbi:hypothetical protein [Deinococcus koreensis]|uniref:DUF3467 domain-containing protein n=1 Tax=Deinococcus koreensis TaxID=2054903 RepID=A0A2K3UYP7_9DEIO|nr:hypothetical protein [Deinococcus koreensis]PNY81654.1 hypothetical protein CVO96_09970 [Deinococcus koreensis]